jgi:LmbE family N-acetylglucosaminyl deacetylase
MNQTVSMDKESAAVYEDTYPLLLPHVAVADRKLWLGDVQLCELSPGEENYCLLCDGSVPRSRIIEQAGQPSLTPQVSAFIVSLLSSLSETSDREKNRRVLVISPTPQTGYLAAGGTIAKWTDAEVLHVVCFSRTTDSVLPEVFTSLAGVSAIRRDEGELCSSVCGNKNHFLDYPAYNVRKQNWSAASSPEHPRDLAAALQSALYTIIRQYGPSVILAPAAIGDHPDHSIITRLIIDFFKQDYFKDTRFLLYQDFPYAVAYNMIDEFLWKTENCFVRVKDHFEDISGQMVLKDILYSIYFSALAASDRQLVNHIAQRNRLACADPLLRHAGGLEHFYELTSFN